VASLSQGRTAAAQCGLFTHKSVPVIFEPPCINVCVSKDSTNNFTIHFIAKHHLLIGFRNGYKQYSLCGI